MALCVPDSNDSMLMLLLKQLCIFQRLQGYYNKHIVVTRGLGACKPVKGHWFCHEGLVTTCRWDVHG